MNEKEKPQRREIILLFLLSALCLVTFRYFFSIFLSTVRMSCYGISLAGDSPDNGFRTERIVPAILRVLPAALPWLGSVAFAFIAFLGGTSGRLGRKGTAVCCTAVSVSALLSAAAFLLSDSLFNVYTLPCFMEAKKYSPFGMFGKDGIDLSVLTGTAGFLTVRYIFLGAKLLLSLILMIDLFVNPHKGRREANADGQDE